MARRTSKYDFESKEEIARLTSEKSMLESKHIIIKKHAAPVGIQGSVGNTDISNAINEQYGLWWTKKYSSR